MKTDNLSKLIAKLLEGHKSIIELSQSNNFSIEFMVKNIVNYYESIIFHLPGNVYWFDKDCVAVGCNKNVLDMFGFRSIDEYRGMTFEELGKLGNWSNEAIHSFKKDTLEVMASGKEKLNVEEPPIPHSDGRLLYFLSTRVPLFNSQGAIIGMVGVSIDITERKKMERALIEARLKAEDALNEKEKAESESREKSKILEDLLDEINQERYYLGGKYKGIYLTKRESECLLCYSRGLSAKETATKLGISPKSVELYISNIKTKFNCRTRSELIAIAIEADFLEGIRPAFLND